MDGKSIPWSAIHISDAFCVTTANGRHSLLVVKEVGRMSITLDVTTLKGAKDK
jgi:hypothetical protein